MSTTTDPSNGNGARLEHVAATRFVPDVDFLENDDEFIVVADMPGVRADDLDVRFERSELHIRGAQASGPPGTNLDFVRTIAMPDGIDSEGIDAALERGVLTVRLRKSASTKPRKIQVRTAS